MKNIHEPLESKIHGQISLLFLFISSPGVNCIHPLVFLTLSEEIHYIIVLDNNKWTLCDRRAAFASKCLMGDSLSFSESV